MSEGFDWGSYVQGTHNKHAARYLAYAEAHKRSAASDYDTLEAEQSNLLAGMDLCLPAETVGAGAPLYVGTWQLFERAWFLERVSCPAGAGHPCH